jgi:hypothetical protein
MVAGEGGSKEVLCLRRENSSIFEASGNDLI